MPEAHDNHNGTALLRVINTKNQFETISDGVNANILGIVQHYLTMASKLPNGWESFMRRMSAI